MSIDYAAFLQLQITCIAVDHENKALNWLIYQDEKCTDSFYITSKAPNLVKPLRLKIKVEISR